MSCDLSCTWLFSFCSGYSKSKARLVFHRKTLAWHRLHYVCIGLDKIILLSCAKFSPVMGEHLSKKSSDSSTVQITQQRVATFIFIYLRFVNYCSFRVPCKCNRQSSINSRAWLRRFENVTGVAKTYILHWAMRTKW